MYAKSTKLTGAETLKRTFFLNFNGYLIKLSWQSCHFTRVPKDFWDNIPFSPSFLVPFLKPLMCGSCGNQPELEKQDLMSVDKLKHSLIADQMFFTFPGCSNPLAIQVCLFQHTLQLENQLKAKVAKEEKLEGHIRSGYKQWTKPWKWKQKRQDSLHWMQDYVEWRHINV